LNNFLRFDKQQDKNQAISLWWWDNVDVGRQFKFPGTKASGVLTEKPKTPEITRRSVSLLVFL